MNQHLGVIINGYTKGLIIQNKDESTDDNFDTKTKVAYYETKGKWALNINSNVNKLLSFPIVNADSELFEGTSNK